MVWRNEELADLAEQRLGKVTARVYAEFLKRIEPRYRRCRDPIRDIDEDDPKKRRYFRNVILVLAHHIQA